VDSTTTTYLHKLEDRLLVSIPAALTDDEVEALRLQILEGIDRHRSRWVLLDFSRVMVCDSFFGRVIRDIVSLARLKGAGVIVSGLQNAVIVTMVHMGMALQLPNIHTTLNLDEALASSRRLRQDSRPGGS
jgi:anti-anti-sigma regulatory factor